MQTAAKPLSPLAQLARSEVFPGVLLVACAVLAIALANSPWAHGWSELWHTHLAIQFGGHALDKSLAHWISDGLMVVFFFFVGLEIKHEVLDGELQHWRAAALPVAAAVGGMAVPALLHAGVVVAHGSAEAVRGWGIPMATDIAFALGVLALLGPRVPVALKVFLATLAIADDLGAVLVIALFYTDQIAWGFLGSGVAVLALSLACNRLGVRATWPYVVMGIVLWLNFLQSGVHATIAGVALAATVPARRALDEREFSRRGRELLRQFDESSDVTPRTNAEQLLLVQELQRHAEAVQAPLQRMVHGLHPVVSHFVVPVFALANAGVALGNDPGQALAHPAGQAVLVGLLVGKPVGVLLFSWLALRFLGCNLPAATNWRHLIGAAFLSGIGFTMALFLDGLAYPAESAPFAAAKLAILLASAICGVIGYAVLVRAPAVPASA